MLPIGIKSWLSEGEHQSRPRSTATPRVETLEAREVPSVAQVWASGSTWVVRADNAATAVTVTQSGANYTLTEGGIGRTWSRPAAAVGRVEFQGGAGGDRFVNNVRLLPVSAFGNGGNDYLEGYDAADYLDGGDGNDTILGYGGADLVYAGGGDDTVYGLGGDDQLLGQGGSDRLEGGDGNDALWGGDGDDVLLGQAGNDQLCGDAGNDRLNGGAGADRSWGGAGDDVLIALDNGTEDFLAGEAGRDTFWVDKNLWFSDRVSGADGMDKVQSVTSFRNGADRTLDGDRIADPAAGGTGMQYRNFAGRPLYSVSGPKASDVRQGGVGDCWLLSGLGAIANSNPTALRQNVVDFDDGTYGVRLGNDFFRVDADLPVNSSNGGLAYAQLGTQDSLWVAVVEKAYAHYRTGANSYQSLANGWPIEVNRAFGSTAAGERAFSSYGSSWALADALYDRWAGGEAVTVGFVDGRYGAGATLLGGRLINMHAYTVQAVSTDWSGRVCSITLRNPWGVDGGGGDSNPNDGLVTLTPDQIYQFAGRVNWGRV